MAAKEAIKEAAAKVQQQDAIVAAPYCTNRKTVPSSTNSAGFAESKDIWQSNARANLAVP